MAASNDPTSRGTSHDGTSSRVVSRVRMVLWLVALIIGLAALHRLGATALSPPAWSPSTWTAWWSANEPVTAAMALMRVVVLAIGWYLLAVTALTLLTAWTRAAAAGRLLRIIAVRSLRETVAAIVGVAMVSATSGPAAASTLHVREVTTPVAVQLAAEETREDREVARGALDEDASDALRRLREGAGRFIEEGGSRGRSAIGDAPPSVARQDEVPRSAPEREVLRPSPEGEVSGATSPQDGASASSPPLGDRDSEEGGADEAPEHLVVAGESFWSIARDHLQAVGAPSDEVAIAAYWLVLIDANRDRLVVADEPDLILPGQRLTLPEVEASLTAEAGS